MKQRMLTPGPTPLPEETLLEMAKPVFYHRSAKARELLLEVQEDLQYIFCTKNPVLTLTCSGTGGMEAAVANCVPPGGKVICLIAGRWGERWKHLCKAFGVEAINVTAPLRPTRSAQSTRRGAGEASRRHSRRRHFERDGNRCAQRHCRFRQAGCRDAGGIYRGLYQRPRRYGVPHGRLER